MTEQTVDLGYAPRAWQLRVHNALKRFSVLVVHRRAGKTVLAIATKVDAALRTKKTRARYAYVAPLLKQAKAVAWDYLKHYARKIPGTIVNESELWVEFVNGARIRVYGADNPDALRGLYLDGVVLDEVADMRPEVWGEIIRPALADRKGWALFIGTPKGINLFSELYEHALADPDWYAGLFTHEDTQALDAGEVQAMRGEMTEQQFRQELLCDFGAASENQLISFDLVQAASKRHLTEDVYGHAPKVIGVDVARYGGDRSVIVRRQGLASWKPKVFTDIDNMTLADHVAREITEWGADACFIDAGRGEGVIDRLLQLGYAPIPVDFGGKALSPGYVNRRTEMYAKTLEWLKAGGAIADMAELRADLCGPTFSYDNARGVMVLESKDDMKQRGLRSPDIADALVVTHAAPVTPRQHGQRLGTTAGVHGAVVFDYDPFAARDA